MLKELEWNSSPSSMEFLKQKRERKKSDFKYSRISNPCDTSPNGVPANPYSCSLAINFLTQPIMPSVIGNLFVNPVILPLPPRNTGSRNVMRENRPFREHDEKREKNALIN